MKAQAKAIQTFILKYKFKLVLKHCILLHIFSQERLYFYWLSWAIAPCCSFKRKKRELVPNCVDCGADVGPKPPKKKGKGKTRKKRGGGVPSPGPPVCICPAEWGGDLCEIGKFTHVRSKLKKPSFN